ncbi:MAG: serine/threonine protein kinase, partial [Planctomycetes bacterium]|nr:serine/threonine protein kinase [Planctomycetota bacterium]
MSERLDINDSDERLPFGELAVLEEMLTRDQLNALLYQQADRRETEHKNVRIGTLLVREGYLTRKQAKRILKIQGQDGPIEGFQLQGHLGSGGMGSVFSAIELETGRELALKILPPRATRDVRYRTRFLREATLLQKLDHKHLVRSSSHGESNGHLYFAMELVDGPTGRGLIKRDGAMREPDLLRLTRQLLNAMQHYWSELIVHRDIKPENILFTKDEQTALLADLGLSRQLDDDVHITTVGKTLGTPLYISPEMARGRQDIDIRADLYSLGATLYHFGTGVTPFVGASQADLLRQHVEDPPLRPRLKNPRLSKGMEAILLKLLEKDPRDRFAGPSDALSALDRLEAGQDPVPERKRRTWSGGERHLRSSAERRGKGHRQGTG